MRLTNPLWMSHQDSLLGAFGQPSEMIEKLKQRFSERFPVATMFRKPLSPLQQEGRAFLTQILETEWPNLAEKERHEFLNDFLAGSIGFSPLENLIRDQRILEIVVLSFDKVIFRKKENWFPSSDRFPSELVFRNYLKNLRDSIDDAPLSEISFCGDTSWDFRALALLPPGNLGLSPMLTLTRRHSAVPDDEPSSHFELALRATKKKTLPSAPAQSDVASDQALSDSLAAIRDQIILRVSMRCASVGIYDLSQVSLSELQRLVKKQIHLANSQERLGLDENAQRRLLLAILKRFHQ